MRVLDRILCIYFLFANFPELSLDLDITLSAFCFVLLCFRWEVLVGVVGGTLNVMVCLYYLLLANISFSLEP